MFIIVVNAILIAGRPCGSSEAAQTQNHHTSARTSARRGRRRVVQLPAMPAPDAIIWAIGGPLTRVSQGPSRSLAVYRMPSSGRSEGRICRIPKLTVPLLYCLWRGLRLKDGPEVQEQPLSVFG